MFDYDYNSQYNILKAKANKVLTISGIRNHYKFLEENRNLPKVLKVLIDCRTTKMDVNPEEIKGLSNQLEITTTRFESLREAILVKKPFETAIAQIFEMNYNTFKNFEFNVFSTEKAALSQLFSDQETTKKGL